MTPLRVVQIVLWALALLATAGYAALLFGERGGTAVTQLPDPSPSAIETDFALTDHTGAPRQAEDFRGKWLMVFFGFTHCPDICPTGLADMAAVVDALGPGAAAVQPLFITVNPERDTPEALAEYLPAFHPAILGLTGSKDAVEQAAAGYRAHFETVPNAEAPGSYEMGHSSAIYLVDPAGRFVRVYGFGTPVDEIVGDLAPRIGAAS